MSLACVTSATTATSLSRALLSRVEPGTPLCFTSALPESGSTSFPCALSVCACLAYPLPSFRGDCYPYAAKMCVLHGVGAWSLAPLDVFRITVGCLEMARDELRDSYPSPIPPSVRDIVMLFQVQKPWEFSHSTLFFVLACTSTALGRPAA